MVNADGSITTPTYAIAGGSYDNVGDALEAIDTTLDDALLWDETANGGNGAFSAAHGKDKTASVITNVANGAVSATSSDAINGSQLYTPISTSLMRWVVMQKSTLTELSLHRLTPLQIPITTTSVKPWMRLIITLCCGMQQPITAQVLTAPVMTARPALSQTLLMVTLVKIAPTLSTVLS